jgi:carboxymethylenebutenolidase
VPARDLTYSAASGQLGAYVAEPQGEGPWPGVVVVMDALGLSDDIRAQADRLAANGYLAFAPDLYSGRGLRCVLATLAASRTGSGPAYGDLDAARRWLTAREDCSGRVGIIGFCMGGGFAVQCAPRLAFDAASVNYGELPRNAATRLAGSCPVVGSFGRRDLMLPGRAERLERALGDLGVPHDVKEYPDAGHSFMNRVQVSPPFGAFVNLLNFDYHEPSSEDAWARILDFFGAHLKAPAPAEAQKS